MQKTVFVSVLYIYTFTPLMSTFICVCVCVCVSACVRACVRKSVCMSACVRACVNTVSHVVVFTRQCHGEHDRTGSSGFQQNVSWFLRV